MPEMYLRGIDERAKQARSALNRLHFEMTYALDQGKSIPDGFDGLDLAEVLAIAVQIGRLIDEHLPANSPQRDRFESGLEFMKGYHNVPR
jgi:hypothetical protein